MHILVVHNLIAVFCLAAFLLSVLCYLQDLLHESGIYFTQGLYFVPVFVSYAALFIVISSVKAVLDKGQSQVIARELFLQQDCQHFCIKLSL